MLVANSNGQNCSSCTHKITRGALRAKLERGTTRLVHGHQRRANKLVLSLHASTVSKRSPLTAAGAHLSLNQIEALLAQLGQQRWDVNVLLVLHHVQAELEHQKHPCAANAGTAVHQQGHGFDQPRLEVGHLLGVRQDLIAAVRQTYAQNHTSLANIR